MCSEVIGVDEVFGAPCIPVASAGLWSSGAGRDVHVYEIRQKFRRKYNKPEKLKIAKLVYVHKAPGGRAQVPHSWRRQCCKSYPSYSGCSGLVGSTHTRSTASNFEQVANLLCAQANSASYPQRDGKWVVATAAGWMLSVADWGDGVSASCTVGPIVR